MKISNEALRAAVGYDWSTEVMIEARKAAADVVSLDPEELMEKTQARKVSHARQGAIWLAHMRGVSNASLSRFYDMDHTTIGYAIDAAQARHDAWSETAGDDTPAEYTK